MAIKTTTTIEKETRNKNMKSEFKELMKVKGSQRTAVYELLKVKYKVSFATVGRIVNK